MREYADQNISEYGHILRSESSVFKEMPFAETNEIIIGHYSFFLLVADEAFFDKFRWLATATGSAYSSSWCMLKTTNLKIGM